MILRTAALAALATGLIAPALAETAAPSGVYAMDDSHASVTWKIKHLGLAPYTAQFETVNGTLTFDSEDPSKSSVTATIAAASVDTDFTGNERETVEQWHDNVRGFLKAGEHPEITFTSTAVSVSGDATGTVTGDLTFAGVTKPVTLDVTLTGALEQHPFVEGKGALGFTASGVIKRSDFGVLAGSPLDGALGDDVAIEIAAEFIQQDA